MYNTTDNIVNINNNKKNRSETAATVSSIARICKQRYIKYPSNTAQDKHWWRGVVAMRLI